MFFGKMNIMVTNGVAKIGVKDLNIKDISKALLSYMDDEVKLHKNHFRIYFNFTCLQ